MVASARCVVRFRLGAALQARAASHPVRFRPAPCPGVRPLGQRRDLRLLTNAPPLRKNSIQAPIGWGGRLAASEKIARAGSCPSAVSTSTTCAASIACVSNPSNPASLLRCRQRAGIIRPRVRQCKDGPGLLAIRSSVAKKRSCGTVGLPVTHWGGRASDVFQGRLMNRPVVTGNH